MKGRRAGVEFRCPSLHVGTCTSRLLGVAQNHRGEWVVVGDITASAARGSSTAVAMQLTVEGRQAMRGGPLDVYFWMPAIGDDTQNTILPTTFVRR